MERDRTACVSQPGRCAFRDPTDSAVCVCAGSVARATPIAQVTGVLAAAALGCALLAASLPETAGKSFEVIDGEFEASATGEEDRRSGKASGK